MPNNGFKKYNFLVLFDTVSGLKIEGQRKENSPFDTDYVPPVFDPFSCPVPITTTTTTTDMPIPTTTTTTTVPPPTTTTTTTTANYLTGNFTLNNGTDNTFVAQLFSSITSEDRLGVVVAGSKSFGTTSYQRNVNLGNSIFVVDLTNSGSAVNIHIVITINGNQVYVGDASNVVSFEQNLGSQQAPDVVITIS